MLGAFTSIGGVLLLVRGLTILDCRSISFSRTIATCYERTDFGQVSGTVGGLSLIIVGLGLFVAGLIRLSSSPQ